MNRTRHENGAGETPTSVAGGGAPISYDRRRRQQNVGGGGAQLYLETVSEWQAFKLLGTLVTHGQWNG